MHVECCYGNIIHTVPMPFLLVWCWYRQWVARSEDGLRASKKHFLFLSTKVSKAPSDLPNRVTHTSVNTCGQMYMKYNLLQFKQSSEILIFRCWYCDDVNLWIYCGVVEEGQLPWSHLLFLKHSTFESVYTGEILLFDGCKLIKTGRDTGPCSH